MTNNDYRPLISIGIPTYNRASAYLRNAIDRSLEQTYPNIEVIVSDNCSTDSTPDLMKSYTDPRLRYIRQETNIGPNNNFNYCLNQAGGEYFLLFHDDDMIDSDFIAACVSALKPGQAVGAVITGVRVIDEHDKIMSEHSNVPIGPTPVDFIRGWFQSRVSLYLCNTLYNTTRLKEVGGFGSRKNLFDDLVPTFKLVTKYGRADVEDIKASFRRHSANRGSTVSIDDWMEDSRFLLNIMCELLPDESAVIRRDGNLYFSKKMYQYIANGTAVSKSVMDYLRVYKMFGYTRAPLRYLLRAVMKSPSGANPVQQ
jgi:glycosyltransferase involved in cell wall biosynthesis